MRALLPILRRLGAEAAIWYAVSAVFLYAYIHGSVVSADAAFPHLVLVGYLFLGFVLVRCALYQLLPGPKVFSLCTAVIASALLMILLTYYGLVLVGLNSWGRVVSWKLITVYSRQLPQLANALDFPLLPCLWILVLSFAGLVTAMRAYYRRFDWVPLLGNVMSGPRRIVYLCVGSLLLCVAISSFAFNPFIAQHEPISLTLFPDDASFDFEGHAIDPLSAQKYDREQDAARIAYRPNPNANRKNLILIVVDGLRADHLSINGYVRDTTPYLQYLAATGLARNVHHTRASCSDSACGHLSLFSSRFPEQFSMHPFTLQQVLGRYGYQIHAVLAGDHTNFYGLREFWGAAASYYDGSMVRDGYMNDDQIALDRLAAFPEWNGIPTMIQFHVMAAHILSQHDKGPYLPAHTYAIGINRRVGTDGKPDSAIVNYYDNGVAKADRVINSILKTLERKKYLQDSLVVITADHGEALGEHGLYEHANGVWGEVLRIPLLFISYGYHPSRTFANKNFASQVDIAPTILAEFQMPIPVTWVGKPLQDHVHEDFTYFEENGCVGLFDHRDAQHLWKYWVDSRSGDEYAFNLKADSNEQINVITHIQSDLRQQWRSKLLANTYITSTR